MLRRLLGIDKLGLSAPNEITIVVNAAGKVVIKRPRFRSFRPNVWRLPTTALEIFLFCNMVGRIHKRILINFVFSPR